MIYIGFDKESGRPLGYVSTKTAFEAAKNWPDQDVIEYTGEGAPDLSTVWVVSEALVDRTDQGAVEDLVETKKAARRTLADQVNSFIDTKTKAEGGGNRYDSGFKITTVNLKVEYRAALAAGGLTAEQETGVNAKLTRIGELEAWMNAVMTEYQTKAAAVLATTTIEEAQALFLNLDKFKIGAAGEGAVPDPDVYLSEIA